MMILKAKKNITMETQEKLSREQIKEMVYDAIHNQWGFTADEIKEDVNIFDEYEADNEMYLDHVEMLIFIAQKYGYDVPDADFEEWTTVKDMIDGILAFEEKGEIKRINHDAV